MVQGTTIGFFKGDTRSVDYGSYLRLSLFILLLSRSQLAPAALTCWCLREKWASEDRRIYGCVI